MSFITLCVGRRLINVCHKRDSLDQRVHVSLKFLCPGIQDVPSLTPLSEGEDTQDKDVKGEIPAGTAALGECAILSYFLFFMLVTSSYLQWLVQNSFVHFKFEM